MVKKIGTNGNDSIAGTGNADELWGRGGNDSISGAGGADYMHGEGGNDGLYGGSGNDRMWGGTGVDALFGQDGADQLYGEYGDDYIDGGIGNDWLVGGAGNDRLRGGDGNDHLDGGTGENDLRAGAGDDVLIDYARSGTTPQRQEFFDGGSGGDTLAFDYKGTFTTPEFGDPAPWLHVSVLSDGTGPVSMKTDPDEGDTVEIGEHAGIETFKLGASEMVFDFSASTSATVYGGRNGDRLEGKQGDQTFIGGAGADEYRFLWRDGFSNGHDRVVGFDADEGDLLQFSVNVFEGENDQHITISTREANGHTVFTLTGDDDGKVYNTIDVDAVNVAWIDGYFIG